MRIICGDSALELKTLDSDSVHMVVTSPPYDKLRTCYAHDFDFDTIAKEIFRVLVLGGVCCWNVNDSVVDGSETLTSCKQKIFFVEQCGFRIHDTMIWEKIYLAAPNASVYHQMFEYIFVLSKGRPRVFNPISDRPNKWAGASPFSYNSKRQTNGEVKKTKEQKDRGVIADFGRRTNVWNGKSRAQEQPCQTLEHPAMMPSWLARDLILSWSNVGDMILDPFAGSGTTGKEALSVGRDATLIELDPKHCELIREQTNVTAGMF